MGFQSPEMVRYPGMPDNKPYVFKSIAQSVIDHGAETMFGLMGDANLFMVDHYVRACKGTFVPVAFEGSAILMALAFSKVSESVGVATVVIRAVILTTRPNTATRFAIA